MIAAFLVDTLDRNESVFAREEGGPSAVEGKLIPDAALLVDEPVTSR